MTWQKYKLNLRNSLLLEEYFWVLQQIANEKGIHSSTAKTTINKWKKGILAL